MSNSSIFFFTLFTIFACGIVAHRFESTSIPIAQSTIDSTGLLAHDILPASVPSSTAHALSIHGESVGDSKNVIHSSHTSMAKLRAEALQSVSSRWSLYQQQHATSAKHMESASVAPVDNSDYVCPSATERDMKVLLSALSHANDDCVKSISTALNAITVNAAQLRPFINAGIHETSPLARKNAIHVLGDICWSHSTTGVACSLLKGSLSEEMTSMLHNRMELESEDSVVNDAIWVLSAFYRTTSTPSVQHRLVAIALNNHFSSATRFRAITTIGILIANKPNYTDSDITNIIAVLQSSDPIVRAEAAYLITKLNRQSIATEAALLHTLEAQVHAESSPAVHQFMLEAVDHMKFTTMATAAQTAFENTNLATTLSKYGLSIRTGLAAADTNCLITAMNREKNAFLNIMGSNFVTPLTGSASHSTMTLFVFATRTLYQSYMSTYIGAGQNAGGLYMNGLYTLYTYQRTSSQSTISLNELVLHEFGHYLHSRYLFSNYWVDNAFFTQPKGWLDEGTAEFWSTLNFNGQGCFSMPLRSNYLRASCASYPSSAPAQINTLINQRIGYDQTGTFDYNGGYFFIYFMMRSHRPQMLAIYNAVRAGTYNVANFQTLTGLTISALQTEFDTTFRSYCNNRSQFDKTDVTCAVTDTESSCTICGHGFVAIACPVAGGTTTPPTPTVTAPGAPTAVTAKAGDGSAIVTFAAPASNGGAAVTSYTVTSAPGAFTASGAATSITVGGLTNGVSYTFTVKATNSAGAGAASAASAAVTPAAPVTVPGAPTGVKATAASGSATVSFAAPASNGGAAVTSYTATSSPGSRTATGTTSPLTITGLTNGVSYTFTVKATNSAGASAASAASAAITPNAPAPPTPSSSTGTSATGTLSSTGTCNCPASGSSTAPADPSPVSSTGSNGDVAESSTASNGDVESSTGSDDSNNGSGSTDCPCLCCSGSACSIVLTKRGFGNTCSSTCSASTVCPTGMSLNTANSDPYGCARQTSCGLCQRIADSQCSWSAGSCKPINSIAAGESTATCPASDTSATKDMALSKPTSDARAVDGNDATFWYSTAATATWTVDLQSSYYLSSIAIRQRYASKVRSVSISNDLPVGSALAPPASSFTNIHTNDAVAAVWNTVSTITANGIKARFIQITLSNHYVEAEINTVSVFTMDGNTLLASASTMKEAVSEEITYLDQKHSSTSTAAAALPYIIAFIAGAFVTVVAVFTVRYVRSRKAAGANGNMNALPSPVAELAMSPMAGTVTSKFDIYLPISSPTASLPMSTSMDCLMKIDEPAS